ncbi:hypothetical protein K461DRAFT_283896 [Myriangium duriaei CBS 260.36]|uniref:Shikimate dehydrogenase substrate binding N-terminal domain-containing protein n=1 Tax=Myriangium duriaei CBS 260.36 TaxID=1168546 RepID=A0A9P4MS46_9PEZI|nr:hypothetical protein K461DRAFT_283896 [Myriangium duriaei CBS 260.36]
MTVPSDVTASKSDLLPNRHQVEKFGFLFGYPISHSFSPLFHRTIYQSLRLKWEFFFLESPKLNDIFQYLHEPNFLGCAVTMPHKVSIIPHLDELTPEADAVGACNTIYFHPDQGGKRKLIGTNTDIVGVKESFLQNISEPERKRLYEGRPAMVVGGGGAARASLYAVVEHLKCKTVYLVNRDKNEVDVLLDWCKKKGFGDGMMHVETVEQAEKLESVGAIVACVPDIPPKTTEEKTARAVLEHFLNREHKGAILEMAYHPEPWTSLAKLSETLGWKVLLGTEAMIYQGLAQDQLWTGKSLEELPVDTVKKVIADELAKAAKH